MAQSLVANFSSLMAAQLCHRGCLLLSAALVARALGSETLGRLLSALSFVWLFWAVVDGGLSELFVREVAARREPMAALLGPLLRVKGWLAAAGLALIGASAWAMAPMRHDWVLTAVLGVALVAETYATFFRLIFRIREEMGMEALLWAADGLLRLGVVAVVLASPSGADPLLAIGAGWAAVSLVGWGVAMRVSGPVRPPSAWSPAAVEGIALLGRGLPFALIYTLSFVNLRGLIVLVGLLRGHAEAGYFGSAERLLEAALLLPITFGQALLPVSARVAAASPGAWRTLARRSLGRAAAISVGAAAALAAARAPLVALAFGPAFAEAARLLATLAWALVPLAMKPIAEKLLCGLRRQGSVWRWYAGVAAVHLVAAAAVVPSYGVTGAAWCLLAAEAASAAGLLVALWRARGRSPAEAGPAWPKPLRLQEAGV
jgi:O-antigen/teichoic acid export membrane protein